MNNLIFNFVKYVKDFKFYVLLMFVVHKVVLFHFQYLVNYNANTNDT